MRHLSRLFLFALLLPLTVASAASPIAGRWRLDPARSTALDGWTAWDLVISVAENEVTLKHDMQLRTTLFSATNVVDTARPVSRPEFFRVQQRHMAVYADQSAGAATNLRASFMDAGRTLRIEADTPVEISQGKATMRIYSEYRVLEGDRALELIELHSSRPRPLVYHFNRVTEEK